MDDILLNKAAIIERCMRRIKKEYAACPKLDDYVYQDSIILNVQRACEAAIDMAMHVTAQKHLGVPTTKAQAFALLHRAEIIPVDLATSLADMVAFRNLAVHDYQDLDLNTLRLVIEEGYRDLVRFCGLLGVKIKVE